MIDWDRIENLLLEVGHNDFREVMGLFTEEVAESITRLAEATDANIDPAQLERELHFLKGCALNLGFTRLAALCGRGESDAASGRAAGIDIREIIDCFHDSRAVLATRAASLGIDGLL